MAECSTAASDRIAAVEMVLVALLWGGFFVVGKIAIREAPPAVVATLRFAVTAVVCCVLLAFTEPAALRPRRRDLPLALLLGATGVAAYNILAFVGFTLAPAADGAMISPALNPVLTALVAAKLFGERLTRQKGVGLVLSCSGLFLVFSGFVSVAPVSGSSLSARLTGDLLFVASAFAWSAYTLVGRYAVDRFSPLAATTYSSLTGVLLLVPMAVPGMLSLSWAHLSVGFWGMIAFLSLGSSVAGFLLWYDALKRIGASRAAGFLPLVPVFGVVLSAILLGDRPSSVQLLGMGIAGAGVYVSSRAAVRAVRSSKK